MKTKYLCNSSVEETQKMIMLQMRHAKTEIISLSQALGRTVARDIISKYSIPTVNNSAMDGYALRFEDVVKATRQGPVILPIISEVRAGGEAIIRKKQMYGVIRIMTGAPIPLWCNAVVPIEETLEHGSEVSIFQSINKFENIRFAGEDIKKGAIVVKKGTKLDSAEIGLLASVDATFIAVYRKPTIAVLSTGDEIVEVGKPIKRGQIRNSNAHILIAEIKKAGAIPKNLGIVCDNINLLKKKIITGLKYDMLITSGGVSKGKYDYIKKILLEINAQIHIDTVRMKPGKPFVFATKGKTKIFCLPGNPVSVLVTFILFVRPAILNAFGNLYLFKPSISASINMAICKKKGRVEFLRGNFKTVNGNTIVTPLPMQGSGVLSSMSKANCLIVLPGDCDGVDSGEIVSILLFDHEEIS